MPWKECHVDGRASFGLSPACSTARRWPALCAEFGISRKTGYKIYDRYKDMRRDGADATAAGGRTGTPISCRWLVEKAIVRLKKDYPSWGAPKIRERLQQQLPGRGAARRSARCMRCWIATAW